MAPLQAFQSFFTILTLYNPSHFDPEDRRTKLKNFAQTIWFSVFMFALLITCFAGIGCLMGMVCFGANATWDQKAITVSVSISSVRTVFMYIAIVFKNHRILSAINTLQHIIKFRQQKTAPAKDLYNKTEKFHKNITKKICKGSIVACTVVFLPPALPPLVFMIFGHPTPDQWTYTFSYRFSIVDSTFIDHYINCLIQTMSGVAYFAILITCISFYVGICFYTATMVRDLEAELAEHDKNPSSLLVKNIKQLASFHIDIIEMAEAIDTIMKTALFHQLLCSALIAAINLFVIQMTGLFSTVSQLALIDLVTALISAYFYCKLSENLTTDLSEINIAFYGFAWNELPLKQQRFFLLPIQYAQRDFRLTGLGILDCSLATFLSIIRSSYSYFLMILNFM